MLIMRRASHLVVNTTKANPIATFSTTFRGQSSSPPFPVIPTCPPPTCPCAETPAGLDIERKKDLDGSMAPYAQHVLISTGKADWTSRIENDGENTPWGDFGRYLKAMLGQGGKYADPYNNVMISNSSFDVPQTGIRAYLFPSFQLMSIPQVNTNVVAEFIESFLLPKKLHPAHKGLSAAQREVLTRKPAVKPSFTVGKMDRPTILICSHASRDLRCGIMGPLLQEEFARQLANVGIHAPVPSDSSTREIREDNMKQRRDTKAGVGNNSKQRPLKANVGLISHVGGHVWAGNVIVYLPPFWHHTAQHILEQSQDGQPPSLDELEALAGCGVWYGRVEPKHVEGIVKETVLHGRVIRDLFRGGVTQDGQVLRLPLERAKIKPRNRTMMPD